jgi:hypothetical protein
MADGSELCLPVNALVGARSGPRLAVVAGVHGDEHEGPAALLELSDRLDHSALAGMAVLVPVANPPAFRSASRWNREDGLNMNRIFPGDRDGPMTHRLARLLVDEVIRGSDFLLTIHGWTTGWLTIPYVEYTAGHPTSVAARAGAAAFGLEHLEPLGLLPGRLASLAAEMGIPACEVEVGGEGVTLPDRRAIAERGTIGLMRHLGMLEGEVWRPSAQADVARHQVVASVGGAFRRRDDLRPGVDVAGGARIGDIRGLNGEPLAEVVAPVAGVLAMLRHALSIAPGDLVAVVFAPAEPGAPPPTGLL